MKDFFISTREESPAWVVELGGYLDAHTAPQLEQTFQDMLERERYRIVVDFNQLDYISSAGLGVFMAFIEDVRENQGDIKLAGMTPKVFNVFDLLGFPMLYEIYDHRAEALNKFTEKVEDSTADS
ncbi:MAG: STAS domain-containing protein [Ignavibacteriae bacterium]|nr:STAS domain-containing protein [Ignavibacteriota bacterium]MCB9215564.1 STAS domain-containing protein [Ignavibacteria bacterium]